MKKEVIEAIKDSIEHWKRMIEWVTEQDEEEVPNELSMWLELKEDWGAKSCPLCQQQDNPSYSPGCLKCPLAYNYGVCSYMFLNHLDKNAWGRVTAAKTWEEWLKHAKQMLTQLESL